MGLCVNARIGISKVHGIGLIAQEPILSGSLVWRFDESIDLRLTENQINKLPLPAYKQVLNYAFREQKSGLYILCGDDARFMNHSDTPNCVNGKGSMAGCTMALRDIKINEELTENYYSFDSSAEEKLKSPVYI